MLCFLPWLGITILPSFHGTPWPKFGRRKLSSRILWQLNRFMLLKYLKVMVVTSNDITRQINELLGYKSMSRIEIKRHFPTYSPAEFASIPPPDSATRLPFRVFFAGPIEADKGIFDIVEIANQLQSARPGFFYFDICGEGSQLGALRKRSSILKFEDTVSCHGYTSRTKFTELLAASHAWIVPTRTEYAAGFEMVCAEAILAGRPLVTSAVCPALEDLRDASIEVEPDNIDQYREAIVKLSEDKQLYARKHLACSALHGPFYDIKDSWGAKMIEALVHIKLVRT